MMITWLSLDSLVFKCKFWTRWILWSVKVNWQQPNKLVPSQSASVFNRALSLSQDLPYPSPFQVFPSFRPSSLSISVATLKEPARIDTSTKPQVPVGSVQTLHEYRTSTNQRWYQNIGKIQETRCQEVSPTIDSKLRCVGLRSRGYHRMC